VVTQEEQLLREIGAILDYPSLYMGGPSYQSMQKARHILLDNILKERNII
jgi:hypothetical protein